MNVTTKEAVTKLCPYSSYLNEGNRSIYGVNCYCYCLADGCMMWEWDNKNRTTKDRKGQEPSGHCGLKSKFIQVNP